MSFEVTKQGKLCDQLESLAYDWVLSSIEDQYGVENADDLVRLKIIWKTKKIILRVTVGWYYEV